MKLLSTVSSVLLICGALFLVIRKLLRPGNLDIDLYDEDYHLYQ